jgi:hypothetical protein
MNGSFIMQAGLFGNCRMTPACLYKLDVSQPMVTVAQARKVALSMPGAQERAHHGHPDFRVNGKIFATLWPTESRAVVKLSLADQAALVQMDPAAFSLNAWSYQGATNVHLKSIKLAQFRKLVETSWRKVAPKRLFARVVDEQ